jgi:hypothetical protein
MREATRAIGSRPGVAELPYVEFPPAEMKGALRGAGMSEELAGLLVDLQPGINGGWFFNGVRRTPETATPPGSRRSSRTPCPRRWADDHHDGGDGRHDRPVRAAGRSRGRCGRMRRATRRRAGSGTAPSTGTPC